MQRLQWRSRGRGGLAATAQHALSQLDRKHALRQNVPQTSRNSHNCC